jgi:type IV fimbrial biogenesis protein FimT
MCIVRQNKASKIKGFSLIELLLAVAILGILIALSLPSFQDTIESMTTNSQVKVLLTTLSYARSEAVRQGRNVGICASNDGVDCDAGDWSEGWLVFVNASGTADGDTGSVGGANTLLRVFEIDTLGSNSSLTFTVDLFEYNSLGFSDTAGVQTFLICPSSNNANNARSIEIAGSGRGRRIEDGLTCP